MLPTLPATSNLTKESLLHGARILPENIKMVLMDIAAYDLIAARNYLKWQLENIDGKQKRRKRRAHKRNW